MSSRLRRARRRLGASLRLGILLAIGVGVNVYVFFFRGGPSFQAQMREQSIQGPLGPRSSKAIPPEKVPPPILEDEDASRVDGIMQKTDTLGAALERQGVPSPEADSVVLALAGLWDPRVIHEGQTFTVGFDAEGHVRSLEYRAAPTLTYHVERNGSGKLEGTRVGQRIETRIQEIEAIIEDSLYRAVLQQGEQAVLVSDLVDLFSWDINFYVDPQVGDRVRLIVEKRYVADKFYGYGRILAAEYAGRVGQLRAFWFSPESATGSYYTERGESIVKSLLKTPLKFVRISSKFDRHRLHPILHTERAHLGIDYAAPQGTPVSASARGRVVYVGSRPGSGNTVVLSHSNGLETRYYHLSRFAKGLRSGQTVHQKQVIGYVGMTGLATGPHLHYSVIQGGRFMDPTKLTAVREAPVPGRDLPRFRAVVLDRMAQLDRIEAGALGKTKPQTTADSE